MNQKKKLTGRPVWSMCLVWLLVICLCPSCNSGEARSGAQEGSAAGSPEETVPDTEGPVISGVQALTTTVGEAVSYRTGVTATDDRDGAVMLLVDSSAVNLSVPGEYQVIYSAEDSSGNRTEVTATVVVTEADPDSAESGDGQAGEASLEKVNDLADQILAKIVTDGMSQREKARAIFDYVASHVKYVGASDKSSWLVGAYDGFTTGRGDCFNYYACSKALLARVGIPTVDLQRVNGNSRHYWVLADVGKGYYHFDPCPHPKGHPLTCFLLTETQVRQYTVDLAAQSSYYINYYTYDYNSCPVTVEGMPTGPILPSTKPAPKPSQPAAPKPSQPAAPETTEPAAPETTEPATPETTEPAAPETTEPAAPETTGPAAPETAQPETPPEPAGEPKGEQPEPDGAAQDGPPEAPADTPSDGTGDHTAGQKGEEE